MIKQDKQAYELGKELSFKSLENPILLKTKADMKKIPLGNGVYNILCDKPVPRDALRHTKDNLKYNGLYFWKNGSAAHMRSRISFAHLFASEKERQKGNRANSIKIVRKPLSYFKDTKGQNFSICKDNTNEGWELGINITEERWKDYNFYVSFLQTEYLDNVVERVIKEVVGKPVCNKDNKK